MNIAEASIAGKSGNVACRGIDPEDRLLEGVAGSYQQASTILGPGDGANRSIPALRQGSRPPGREIAQNEDLAIGLVGRARHCSVGERSAVRRNGWQRIRRLVGGS